MRMRAGLRRRIKKGLPLNETTTLFESRHWRVEAYAYHVHTEEGEPRYKGLFKTPVRACIVKMVIGHQTFTITTPKEYGKCIERAYYTDQVLQGILRTRTFTTGSDQCAWFNCNDCSRIEVGGSVDIPPAWLRKQLHAALERVAFPEGK